MLPEVLNKATSDPTKKKTLLQAEKGSSSAPGTMPASETAANIMIDGLLFPQRTRLAAEDLKQSQWWSLSKSQKKNYNTRINKAKSSWEER
eukprot:11942563-Prorocentrum_lima.AAC.1